MAQFLDKSLMGVQQHCLVLNESPDDEDIQTLYIAERSEYKCLVHFQVDLKKMDWLQTSEYLENERLITQGLGEHFMR